MSSIRSTAVLLWWRAAAVGSFVLPDHTPWSCPATVARVFSRCNPYPTRYHLDHLSTGPPSPPLLSNRLFARNVQYYLIRRFIVSGARPFGRDGINHIPGGGGGPVPRLLLSHASSAAGDGAQHLQLVGGLPRGRRGDTLPPDQAERGGDGAEDRGGRGPLRLPR